MTRTKKPELVALLTKNQGYEYGNLYLNIARQDSQSLSGWSGRDVPESVGTLRCTSQAGGMSGPATLYAWEIEDGEGGNYTRLRVAERMAKRLRKVERAMRRMNETEGLADSFGAFAARFMRATGVKTLIDLSGGTSTTWPMNEIPGLINARAKELCDALDGKEKIA